MSEITKKEQTSWFKIFVVCCLVSLFSGALGNWFFIYALDKYYDMPMTGRSTSLSQTERVVVREAKKIVIEQDDQVDEALRVAQESLMGIYLKKTPLKNKEINKVSVLDKYYKLNDYIAQASVLTNDGWLVTNMKLEGNYPSNWYSNYVLIGADRQLYEIDKVSVNKDNNVIYIHIVNAKNLIPAKFISEEELIIGKSVVIANFDNGICSTQITSLDNKHNSRTSKVFKNLSLSANCNNDSKKFLVYDFVGKAVAFFDQSNNLQSATQLINGLNDMLNSTVTRFDFGVTVFPVVDLAGVNFDYGLVVENITENSIAAKNNIKIGDILLTINDEKIKSIDDLSKNINNQSKINLKYWQVEKNIQLDKEINLK